MARNPNRNEIDRVQMIPSGGESLGSNGNIPNMSPLGMACQEQEDR